MKQFKFLVLLVLTTGVSYGQSLSAKFDMGKFAHSDTLSMLELYVSVDARTVNFVTNENKKHQATIHCKAIISKDDDEKYIEEFNFQSPEIDSFATFSEFKVQRRLFVKPDEYKIKVLLDDINTPEKPVELATDLYLKFPEDKISISDIQLLESYTKSDADNEYCKNGFQLITYNSTFYPQHVKTLKYYFELYHTLESIPEGEDFIIQFAVEHAQTMRKVAEVGKYVKAKAKKDMAQIGELSIEPLSSGNYNFVVQVKNKENKTLLITKKYFERSSPLMAGESASDIVLDRAFTDKLDLATIKKYVSSFRAIATDNEEISIKITENTEDTTLARNFVYDFWKKRYPQNPEYFWKRFMQRVDYADAQLTPKTRRGYTSDQGRVYIKYGPPNFIENQLNDPQRQAGATGKTYPYEIWYYNKIEGSNQTNRLFAFVNQGLGTYTFQLIHSNVRGEIFVTSWLTDPNWKRHLYTTKADIRNLRFTEDDY